jgi:acetyltransferase
MRKHYLDKAFEPQSVAVIGATDREASVGRQILQILKRRAYPTIPEIEHPVDLAIICVPAREVPAVLQQCGEHGVGAVIVISAGFAEVGDRGLALQAEILDIARTFDIALIGPNCMGLIRPGVGLNASLTRSTVSTGEVALVAQSGAICTALLDWGFSRGFGFSAVASLGATADVGFGAVLDYLAIDPGTRSRQSAVRGGPDSGLRRTGTGPATGYPDQRQRSRGDGGRSRGRPAHAAGGTLPGDAGTARRGAA